VSFILFSIYFRSLNKFSVISIARRKSENGETGEQCLGRIRPKASASWSSPVAITAQSTGTVRARHAWACGHHDCGHGVARLPSPRRWLFCREVFVESSRAAAGWRQARWWAAGLTVQSCRWWGGRAQKNLNKICFLRIWWSEQLSL
jgi:hypothetical protein